MAVWVLGPGALGLTLAAAVRTSCGSDNNLELLGKSNKKKSIIVKWNDSVLLKSCYTAEQLKSLIQFSIWNCEIRSHLAPPSSKEPLTVYVCVPPHNVVNALKRICDLFPNLHCHPAGVDIVFCNNGLLPEFAGLWPETFKNAMQIFLENDTFRESHLTLKLWRALFFVGVTASHSGLTEIVHNGGLTVQYGHLTNKIYLHPKSSSPNSTQDLVHLLPFIWLKQKDLVDNELQKFFVNLALATIVGPRLIPNGLVSNLPAFVNLRSIAELVTLAVKHQVTSVETLIKSFEFTINETRENVNSVSLAWFNGNVHIFDELLQMLELRLPSQLSNAQVSVQRSLKVLWQSAKVEV